MRDNWFDKTIIKKNKNIIRLLANIIFNKFLKKTIVLNIILFAETKEIKIKKRDFTSHGNNNWEINNTLNILKLV